MKDNELNLHPIVNNISLLLEFVSTGSIDVDNIKAALNSLASHLPDIRRSWIYKIGKEKQEYLEFLLHFVLSHLILLLDQGDGKNSGSSDLTKKRRTNFKVSATKRLRTWLEEHAHNPYPTVAEKMHLCEEVDMSEKQLDNWFINARRRYLKG